MGQYAQYYSMSVLEVFKGGVGGFTDCLLSQKKSASDGEIKPGVQS